MLVIKRSAGVETEMNQRNPLHTGREACKLKPRADITSISELCHFFLQILFNLKANADVTFVEF